MKKLFFTLSIILTSVTFGQTNFDEVMTNAFKAWQKGNDQGIEQFQKVAHLFPKERLPQYYLAFTQTLKSFEETNPIKKEELIDAAKLIIAQLEKDDPTNEEVFNLKALNLSAEIMLNPMRNGFALMDEVQSVYAKAKLLNPNNPRTILGKAEFNIVASKFVGGDLTNDCKAVEKALALFATEQTGKFEPNWGKDRAENLLNKECKK